MRTVVSIIAASILSTLTCTASAVLLEEANWEGGVIPNVWSRSISSPLEVPETVALNGSIQACNGNYGLKIKLTYRDDRSGYRNELSLVGPNKEFDYGREYWLGWAIYLPPDYAVDKWADILMQFHGIPDRDSSGQLLEPYRHPPVSLETSSDGKWRIVIKGNSRKISTSVGDSTRRASYTLGDFTADRGKWTEFVMRVRFHYNSTGRIEMWKNGQKMVSDAGENTYYDDKPPYLKIGIYKPAWKPHDWGGASNVPSRLFYYDAVRLADGPSSLSAVAPDCGGTSTNAAPDAPVLVD